MVDSRGASRGGEAGAPLDTGEMTAKTAKSTGDWILITSEDLPALPHVAVKVLQVLTSPLCSAGQVEALIRTDVSLAQRLLRMANSVMFGGSQKVGDIKGAIVRLGFNRVKNLVLIAATKDVLGSAEPIAQDLWRHSLGTALATQIISQALGKKPSDDLFLAGLFHDIGKVLIINQKPKRYKEILDLACAHRRAVEDVEKDVFHFSHEEVGVLLLKKWNFPDTLAAPVRFHHRIQDESCGPIPNEESVAIVGTADLISDMLRIGLLTSVPQDPLKARSTRILGLGEEAILAAADRLLEVFFQEVVKFD